MADEAEVPLALIGSTTPAVTTKGDDDDTTDDEATLAQKKANARSKARAEAKVKAAAEAKAKAKADAVEAKKTHKHSRKRKAHPKALYGKDEAGDDSDAISDYDGDAEGDSEDVEGDDDDDDDDDNEEPIAPEDDEDRKLVDVDEKDIATVKLIEEVLPTIPKRIKTLTKLIPEVEFLMSASRPNVQQEKELKQAMKRVDWASSLFKNDDPHDYPSKRMKNIEVMGTKLDKAKAALEAIKNQLNSTMAITHEQKSDGATASPSSSLNDMKSTRPALYDASLPIIGGGSKVAVAASPPPPPPISKAVAEQKSPSPPTSDGYSLVMGPLKLVPLMKFLDQTNKNYIEVSGANLDRFKHVLHPHVYSLVETFCDAIVSWNKQTPAAPPLVMLPQPALAAVAAIPSITAPAVIAPPPVPLPIIKEAAAVVEVAPSLPATPEKPPTVSEKRAAALEKLLKGKTTAAPANQEGLGLGGEAPRGALKRKSDSDPPTDAAPNRDTRRLRFADTLDDASKGESKGEEKRTSAPAAAPPPPGPPIDPKAHINARQASDMNERFSKYTSKSRASWSNLPDEMVDDINKVVVLMTDCKLPKAGDGKTRWSAVQWETVISDTFEYQRCCWLLLGLADFGSDALALRMKRKYPNTYNEATFMSTRKKLRDYWHHTVRSQIIRISSITDPAEATTLTRKDEYQTKYGCTYGALNNVLNRMDRIVNNPALQSYEAMMKHKDAPIQAGITPMDILWAIPLVSEDLRTAFRSYITTSCSLPLYDSLPSSS